MTDALTVAHEVAHYVHWKRNSKKVGRGGKRWHCKEHQILTTEGQEILVKLVQERRDQLIQGAVKRLKAESIIQTFMANLPPAACCPKCGQMRWKVEFGYRVMKRDDKGIPTSIRRQSYCRLCR